MWQSIGLQKVGHELVTNRNNILSHHAVLYISRFIHPTELKLRTL